MNERKQHPSGRPIRKDEMRMLGFNRRPYDEPLTPGLRKQEPTNAIGFMANLVPEDFDE